MFFRKDLKESWEVTREFRIVGMRGSSVVYRGILFSFYINKYTF